jgi:phosphatidate cytidylyltransferase
MTSPLPTPGQSGLSELNKRILSGIVMALIATSTAFIGGWPFAIVWTCAALAVAYEWQKLVHEEKYTLPFAATATAVLFAVAAVILSMPSLLLVSAGLAIVVAGFAPASRRESAAAVIYAGGLGAAILLCRGENTAGLIVLGWLFAVVWGTDILAYFTGRSLGGPKLWPAVSPKKTWSGAIGGLIGGVWLGAMLLKYADVPLSWQHIVLSIAFSVLTQGGDLFESAMKRRHNAKDSGNFIPGHGGFMDRLDGFIFAVIFAAIFGVLRGGFLSVPAGLLIW